MIKKYSILKILIVIGALLLLTTMLAYPFCEDHAKSAVAGEMSIRRGAVAYNDFIDTRSQMIFWIYGFTQLLFGHNEWGIRAFDILFHLVTLGLFYKILRHFLKDETVAFTSAIVYVVFYVGSGYVFTALAETFAFLPCIMLFYFTEKAVEDDNAFRNGLLAGVCAGLIFWLKFTLLIIPAASIVYLLINRSFERKRFIRFCAGLLISLSVIIGCYAVFLLATGSMNRFLEAMNWLRYYGTGTYISGPPQSNSGHFKMFPSGLLLEYGFINIFLLGFVIVKMLRKDSNLPSSYTHLALQVFFGLLSVYAEGKSIEYHFARFAFAAVPLISYGLVFLLRNIAGLFQKWRKLPIFQQLFRVGLLIPAVGLFVLYSPFMRIWQQPLTLTSLRLRGMDFGKTLESYNPGYYFYTEIRAVSDTLRTLLKPQDQIFIWGESVGIYYNLNRLPTTICLTSMSMSSGQYTPISWQQSVLTSLNDAPPRFVITQSNDTLFLSGGTLLNENRPIEAWPELHQFVTIHYAEKMTIGHFRIYEWKQ